MSSTHKSDGPEGKTSGDKSALVNTPSRTGKVEMDLIETILDEMKTEFNRSVDIEEDLKNTSDESSKDSADDESVAVKKESSTSDIKTEAETEKRDPVELKTEGDNAEKEVIKCDNVESDNVETGKATLADNGNSERTLRTPDDRNKKSKRNVENESNNTDTLSCDTETGNETVLSTPSEPRVASLGKRSLRSKAAAAKLQLEEPAGVKRSARRRSKDSPRESVLQSAIARKEKSFSSLSNSKETGRSLRLTHHSPVDKMQSSRASKSPARAQLPTPKSPRLAQQIADLASKEEESTSTTVESPVLNHSDPPVVTKIVRTPVQTSNPHAYTKTGKRRYRPYKGLRYSFTGNNVRRTKPVRRQVKDVTTVADVASEVKKTPEPEESGEVVEVPPAVASQPEEMESADPIAKSHAAEFPTADVCGKYTLSLTLSPLFQNAGLLFIRNSVF